MFKVLVNVVGWREIRYFMFKVLVNVVGWRERERELCSKIEIKYHTRVAVKRIQPT